MSQPQVILQLQQFLPFKLADLTANVSDGLSQVYASDFNLNVAQWRLLAQLAEQGECHAKTLIALTGLDKSLVSRTVNELEQRNWLCRRKSPQDSRKFLLALTEQGKTVYSQIVPRALDWEAKLLNALSTSEYRDLLRIMDKLQDQVKQPKSQ